MSSAILYLAIVAIWACVLVPRWLHRSHEISSEEGFPAEQEETADHAEDSGPEERAATGRPGAGAREFATLREQVVEVTTYVEWEAPAKSTASAGPAGPAGPVGPADHRGPAPRVRTAARAASGRGGQPGARDRACPRSPVASRAHALRARRRMLTILVTLAVAAVGCAFVGLTRWWVVIPPAGLLGGYLLLLREAGRSDAENARGLAEPHARAVLAARQRAAIEARDRARRAREALPQRTAEIIDISALAAQAGDQLYDQYADAEVRAVGD